MASPRDNKMPMILDTLIRHMGEDWKRFVRLLGVSDVEINIAVADHPLNIYEQAYCSINVRFQTNPDTQWKHLKQCLLSLNRHELIKIVEKDILMMNEDEGNENQDMDITLTFNTLSKLMVNDWRYIARELGIDNYEIQRIAQKYNDGYEQAYQALRLAKQIKPELGWRLLKERLNSMNFHVMVKAVEDEFPKLIDKKAVEKDQCHHSLSLSNFGFGLICHNADKDLEDINNIIDTGDLKDRKKSVIIYRGAFEREQLSSEQWLVECEKYYQRYFGKLDYFSFNEDREKVILTGFKTFIEDRKPGFIIQNYNIIDHFKFLGLQELLKKVQDNQDEKFAPQLLAYETQNNAIYFVTLSSAIALEDIKTDIKSCAKSIRLFTILHKNMLLQSGLVLVGIVVLDTDNKTLIDQVKEYCNDCSFYVVSKSYFKAFTPEFQQFLSLRIYNNRENIIRRRMFHIDHDIFKRYICNILAFMSQKGNIFLPNLSDDVSEQIEQVVILLSPQQLSISCSDDKRMIIQGSHGSGKSIIGRTKLEILASSEEKKQIFYIDYDGSPALAIEMKKYVKYLNNKYQQDIKCYRKEELKADNMVDILNIINKTPEKKQEINVIFEEVPLDEFTENEILSVVNIFQQTPFKGSTIIIIKQSVSRERCILTGDKTSDQEAPSSNTLFKKQIEMLHRLSNFNVKTLTKTARTTLAIEKVVKVATNILESNVNTFSHANLIFKDDLKNTSKTTNTLLVEEVTNIDISETDTDLSTADNENDTEKDNNSFSNTLTDDYTSNETDLELSTMSNNNAYNFDDIMKNIMNKKQESSNNSTIIESRFSYHTSTSSIHNIEGPKPIVIYPFREEGEISCFAGAYKIMKCFEKLLDQKVISTDKQAYVLHFENSTPQILVNASGLFNEKMKTKGIIPSLEKDLILIQRFSAARGMEYDCVVVVIDANEYHLRHYLVEAMTRSKCHLTIMITGGTESENGNPIRNIIDTCIASKLVDVIYPSMIQFDNQEETELKKYFVNNINDEVENVEQEIYVKKLNEKIIMLLSDGSEDNNVVNLKEKSKDEVEVETEKQGSGIYPMQSNPRGKCLIFNNKSAPNRKAYQKDVERLSLLFTWLKFKVDICDNYSSKKMREKLEAEANDDRKKNHDCFVTCIISSGVKGHIIAGDEVAVSIEDIIYSFTPDKCPGLFKKPKIFFIQGCQGTAYIPQDIDLNADFSIYADILLYMSALPGALSYRNSREGTWFIQALCKIFEEESMKSSLYKMILKINEVISNRDGTLYEAGKVARMMPNIERNTLRKELYFNPSCHFDDFVNKL